MSSSGKEKLVCLMSGEFDSPVASYLMIKKGFSLVYVHFDAQPYNDGALLIKSRKSIEVLNNHANSSSSKLYVVKHGFLIKEIKEKCSPKYLFVIWRRFMYRCAEYVKEKEGAFGLLTGENIGQVASQTVNNLYVTNKAIKSLVLRPLITYNKEDIISLSKSIGTYDIAVMPSQCLISGPQHPTTFAKLEEIEKEELKLEIGKLMKECIKKVEVEKIR